MFTGKRYNSDAIKEVTSKGRDVYPSDGLRHQYTAISRKVVGKSARDNPERYCGWF